MIEILQIDTPSLGDRSYLATDGTVALVVDPQRDIDRVVGLAAERGVRITHVLETHLHNDYLTGGLALARETGAAYHVSAADQVAFDRVPVSDGDVLEFTPSARIQVLATPGHTFTHLAYVLAGVNGDPVAVFTGGSLLFGATGRTDLLGAAHAAELARAQHASAARLAAALPDQVAVLPTHGFGSFCAATPAASANSSTIGEEKARNPALTLGADRFVAELLAGLDAYPAYYARMGPGNATGPGAPDLSLPHQAGPRTAPPGGGRGVAGGPALAARVRRRPPGRLARLRAGQHARSPAGLAAAAGTPVTLLGETAGQVATAQRELARIGVDRPAAIATGQPEDWAAGEPLASFPVRDFAALASARRERPVTVLDVRRNLEWRPATWTAPCTSRCTSWPGGWVRFPAANCGCTARPGTGRRWRPPCCRPRTARSSRSTTTSATPARWACPWSRSPWSGSRGGQAVSGPVVQGPVVPVVRARWSRARCAGPGGPAARGLEAGPVSGRSVLGGPAADLGRALVGDAAHMRHRCGRGRDGPRVGAGAEAARLGPDAGGRVSNAARACASSGSWTGDAADPPSPPSAPRRGLSCRPARAVSRSGSRSPPAAPGAPGPRCGRR